MNEVLHIYCTQWNHGGGNTPNAIDAINLLCSLVPVWTSNTPATPPTLPKPHLSDSENSSLAILYGHHF